MVKVKCVVDYNDLQLNKLVTTKDDPFIVTKERAKVLVEKGLVKVVEVVSEPQKAVAEEQEKEKTEPKKPSSRKKKK